VDNAQSSYRQTVANYRAVVLNAVQEVSDAMSGQVAQRRAQAELDTAVRAASRSRELSLDRYRFGAASYLEVINAEQSALNYRRQLAQNMGAQLLTSIQMVKALGGGFQAASLNDQPASAQESTGSSQQASQTQ
jgi:outer membrane protein TolC